MRSASRAAIVALGLVTASILASPPGYATAVPAETSVDGTGQVVTDAAGNAIAVAADHYFSDQAVFRYRHVGGGWSEQYSIPGLGRGVVAAASGQVNMPGAVGHVRGTDTGLAAVIRRTDATWTPPVRLDAGITGQPGNIDMAGNADGDFAVSWTQGPSGDATGTTYAAIRMRGGSWHTYVVGHISDLSFDTGPQPVTGVGIDSYGNVTVARTVTSAGSTTHRLLIRRKPVSGAWQGQQQVSAAGQSVRWLDMVIERTGRATLAYQLENASSVRYGQSYVLRAANVGGALTQVWQQPASSPPAIAAAGGRLRVVWATVTGTDPPQGFTQAFNPTAQPVQDLGSDPAGVSGVAINDYGQGVVVSGVDFAAVVHPVTAASLGTGRTMDLTDRQIIAFHAVLGAGSQYFVAVDTHFDLPAGYIEKLVVFRASRA